VLWGVILGMVGLALYVASPRGHGSSPARARRETRAVYLPHPPEVESEGASRAQPPETGSALEPSKEAQGDSDRLVRGSARSSSGEGLENVTILVRVIEGDFPPLSLILDRGPCTEATSKVDGCFAVEIPEPEGRFLAEARREGLAPAFRAFRWGPGLPAPFLEFLLSPAAVLHGIVRAVDDTPIEGAHVWAWSPRGMPPFEQASIELLDRFAGSVGRTVSAADGSFEIPGLSAKKVYRISAGSPHHLLREPFVEARVEDSPLDLRMSRAYLLWGTLGEAGERPPALDPRLDAASETGIAIRLRKDAPWPEAPNAWRLHTGGLRLPDGLSGKSPDRCTVFCWFVADRESLDLGPFLVEAALPGYKPVRSSIMASWLGAGPPSPTRIEIERSVAAFGSVRLSFREADVIVPRSRLFPPGVVTLFFDPEAGAVPALRYECTVVSPRGNLLAGLPAGRFRASAKANGVEFPLDPPHLEVARDGIVDLRVDLPALTQLVVELDTAPMDAVVQLFGKCALRLERKRPVAPKLTLEHQVTDYSTRGLFLSAGTYLLRLHSLDPQTCELESDPLEVEVRGELLHVVVKARNVRVQGG